MTVEFMMAFIFAFTITLLLDSGFMPGKNSKLLEQITT